MTCCAEGWQGADLCQWPFGCFTLMPVDTAGSPRKVPGAPNGDGGQGGRSASEQIVCLNCQVGLGRGGFEGRRSEGEARGVCQAVLPGLVTGGREDFAEPALDEGPGFLLALAVLAARGRQPLFPFVLLRVGGAVFRAQPRRALGDLPVGPEKLGAGWQRT